MSATVNVAVALVERARQTPDHDAVVDPLYGRATRDARPSYTYGELNDASDQIARGLAKMGVTRGMRTALMVPPSFEAYALTFALLKLGAVAVLIDPGMGVKDL